MRQILIIGVLLAGVLSACSNEQDSSDSEAFKQTETEGAEAEVLAENLRIPWEIAEYENTLYISERVGSILSIKDGKQERKQVKLQKSLADAPEAGLLGIAVPADFNKTNQAFAYYSYVEGDEVFQRIVRIEEQEQEWRETDILIDHIPGGQFHQGGRIEIGPDNKLYATTGDATNPDLAQDVESLAGKILRMNQDGSIPEDNPFQDSYVYTYGHRNPQGLAWDEGGQLYATEHGPSGYDEINKIAAGKNYGWPVIQGDETNQDMVTPLVNSGEPSWAPSGMTYYKDSFYFASLRGEAVRKFDLKDQHVVLDGYGRIRDVLATEEGLLFVTNNTDGRGTPEENDDKLMLIKQVK